MITLSRNLFCLFLFSYSIIIAQEFRCGVEKVYYADKLYNTVLIDNQCWLRENLDVGVMIAGVNNPTDNKTIEKHCFNNDISNCEKFGGLYHWLEAMQYTRREGVQGICPRGWHLPTRDEIENLRTSVNNDGNSLKDRGRGTGWGVGTNTTGFSILMAGLRETNGDFGRMGLNTYFWSSSQESPTQTYYLGLNSFMNDIFIHIYYYRNSFSIRCLKDY